MPDNNVAMLGGPLWDAADVVAAGDGVYVKLPSSGRLVHVTRDGSTLVDTGPGQIDNVALAPDGETVVAFVRRTRCVADDPREIRGVKTMQQCPLAYRELSTEVLVLEGAEVVSSIDVSTHYNAVTFSGDGRWAIAWLDVDQGIDLNGAGVVDLTSVLVLDLADSIATPVSVGFEPMGRVLRLPSFRSISSRSSAPNCRTKA